MPSDTVSRFVDLDPKGMMRPGLGMGTIRMVLNYVRMDYEALLPRGSFPRGARGKRSDRVTRSMFNMSFARPSGGLGIRIGWSPS